MAGLYHTLNVGSGALMTTRQGVDTAGHNIANAQTEGYSRQRINTHQRDPLQAQGLLIGNGVFVKNITRAHDRFLETQLNETNQQNGAYSAMNEEMKAIESVFSPEMAASVSDEITTFFNALQDLASYPEELTVRTHLRESADNVVTAFHRVDASLRSHQSEINRKVEGVAVDLSGVLEQIASLNVQINTTEAGGVNEANDLRDQQDKLLRDLTKHVEVNYYRGDHGMLCVRGPGQTLLVDMGHAAKFEVRPRNEGDGLFDLMVVDSTGNRSKVVTDTNRGGMLRGLVDVRDKVINGLLAKNSEMAYVFANAVNQVHRQGYGLNDFKESMGRDFFSVADSPDWAARTIRLSDAVSETTDAISAASSPNAPGDNVIVNELLRLREEKLLERGNATFTDFFANYVGLFGLEVVRSDHMKQANDIVLGDLKARRESVAGVSLDEEATNLMRWQANFTASSKLITTIDEMLETVLSLKR